MSRRVGVVAPMSVELAPFARALSLQTSGSGDDALHTGAAGGTEITAVVSGMGTANAAAATERLLSSGPVDHVVVIGIAGGIPSKVEVGDVVVPAAVFDGPTRAEYVPAVLGDARVGGKLLTSDELVVDADAVARLAEDGFVALDMETASIAAVCTDNDRPWSVFRAISDLAGDGGLDDDVLGLVNSDGTPNVKAGLRYVARKPSAVPRLVRLARGSRIATRAAAGAAVAAITGR